MEKPKFSRYVGIDYSGAKTPTSDLPNLQVYMAEGEKKPEEICESWTREGVAEWIVKKLSKDVPTLVGIDHAFSFPIPYFERYGLKYARPEPDRDWPEFLDDLRQYWPTDQDDISVYSVLMCEEGNGEKRWGFPGWLRLTEKRVQEMNSRLTPKSVFDLGQGAVAYATFGGIPWLHDMRQRLLGRHVHFWPFDGWTIPDNRSAIVEVYPALWKDKFTSECRNLNEHQRDAYSVAAWMSESDHNGRLAGFLKPTLSRDEKKQARIEGWILGAA